MGVEILDVTSFIRQCRHFYYTDYAGVSAAAVGTIMLVSRVFDGISDIIMGMIVDRTRSKYGKARIWILLFWQQPEH